MDEPPETRASLLVRLRDAGDERAWTEFTEIYSPFIKRVAQRRGLQAADADDLAQEVFRTVARAIAQQMFDPARGSFRGWLFRIARNLVVNFLIHQDRHPRGTGDTDIKNLMEIQPAASAEDSALVDAEYRRQLLYWAAEQIRPEFSDLAWNAFWQAGVEGRRAPQVAATLGTTVGTVYHCKSRVMARLRKKIAEVEEEVNQKEAGS